MQAGGRIKIIVVVVIAALVIGIVALNVATTQVPYADQECQTIPFTYNVHITECSPYTPGILFGFGATPATVTCTIQNLENKTGTFTLHYGFRIDNRDSTRTENISIDALGSLSRTDSYNGEMQTCLCYANPPSYQECHPVTKYQTVTIWQHLFG